MQDESVTLSRGVAISLYDMIVGSLDYGSGFLDTEQMCHVQQLAKSIGDVPLVRCTAKLLDDPPEGAKWAHYIRPQCILPMAHEGAHEYDPRPICVVAEGSGVSPTKLPAFGGRRRKYRVYDWQSVVEPSYEQLA